MKSKEIIVQIGKIESNLYERLDSLMSKESEEITGLVYPDISAWKKGKRNWSYEKILRIAGRCGL